MSSAQYDCQGLTHRQQAEQKSICHVRRARWQA
jgi:hypothetical protein